MSKYTYLVITTKANASEADHAMVLSSYGNQGYRLVKEKRHLFGKTTYILERAVEAPKVVEFQKSFPTNLDPRTLLIVPNKLIYEVTEVLMKGVEASKDSLSLEVKKLLVAWISLNRYDLKQKHAKEWKELEE